MLQRQYVYVASVCFSFFKSMLQVYFLDVAYVAVAVHICCTGMFQMFHMFQTYVTVSASCFMYFHWQARNECRRRWSLRAPACVAATCILRRMQQHA
jgi:hypothetical protein